MEQVAPYQAKHKIRIVTAASLFDGHDAAINIMRRMLQASGVEVIHLAHNRSVQEIVQAAVQEDVDAIAISSYQGGHIEYFKYLVDKLRELGASHIRIFGGGGGVIIPSEIEELHAQNISDHLVTTCSGARTTAEIASKYQKKHHRQWPVCKAIGSKASVRHERNQMKRSCI